MNLSKESNAFANLVATATEYVSMTFRTAARPAGPSDEAEKVYRVEAVNEAAISWILANEPLSVELLYRLPKSKLESVLRTRDDV